MTDPHQRLDLNLWLDQELIKRQNKLKAGFLRVLEGVANSFSNETLSHIHQNSKGKKISKGSDLVGFPYQVLDMVRDFTLTSGCDIRIFNWFGHGMFLMLIHGSEFSPDPKKLVQSGFEFSLTDSPWDYPELILEKRHTSDENQIIFHEGVLNLWFKPLFPVYDLESSIRLVAEEVENLLDILKLSSQTKRN